MYHSLIQILSAAKLIGRLKGATIAEMEEGLGVSRRSVYRIIEALEELGYPCYKDEEKGGRYRLTQPETRQDWWVPLPTVSFSLVDRILMEYMTEATARNPALASAVRSLRKKLSFVGAAAGYAFAPKESGAGPGRRPGVLINSSMVQKAMSPGCAQYFSVLLDAAVDHHACEVSYESRESGSVKTYAINPLALFENEDGLYCFVEIPRYGSIRILALERIRELKPLARKFKPPSDFDAERRLADPFGIMQGETFAVMLRFSRAQAPYVRDRAWPKAYQLWTLPDGRLEMSFETGGAFGLTRWILSWGSDAEVVEPRWLRDGVAGELRSACARYRAQPGKKRT